MSLIPGQFPVFLGLSYVIYKGEELDSMTRDCFLMVCPSIPSLTQGFSLVLACCVLLVIPSHPMSLHTCGLLSSVSHPHVFALAERLFLFPSASWHPSLSTASYMKPSLIAIHYPWVYLLRIHLELSPSVPLWTLWVSSSL